MGRTHAQFWKNQTLNPSEPKFVLPKLNYEPIQTLPKSRILNPRTVFDPSLFGIEEEARRVGECKEKLKLSFSDKPLSTPIVLHITRLGSVTLL